MKIEDGTGSDFEAQVDHNNRLATNAITISHAHHEIHDGHSYVASKSQTTANSNDNMTALSFKTPTNKDINLFVLASVTGAAWLYIYEAPTIVDNTGTGSVQAYNRNRNSMLVTGVKDTKQSPDRAGYVTYWDETDAAGANVTWTDGTLISSEQLGAGRNTAGESRGQAEFVLKRDTLYGVILENEGATANIHNIILNWYEMSSGELNEHEK